VIDGCGKGGQNPFNEKSIKKSRHHRSLLNERFNGQSFPHTSILNDPNIRQQSKGAGTLRRTVRCQTFAWMPGGRHMECAYYFDFCPLC